MAKTTTKVSLSLIKNEEDLTSTNNHVPTSFKIEFLQSDVNNTYSNDITGIFKDYVKEIVIEKELGELDRATIKMEHSATADSYKNSSGLYANNSSSPPWIIFQKNYAKNMLLVIKYSYLSSSKYYYKVSSYPQSAIESVKIEALQKLNDKLETKKATNQPRNATRSGTASVDPTRKEFVNTAIQEYVRLVSDKIKEVEDSISAEYTQAQQEATLFSGVPVVHSLKGGENGMVEYDMTMHGKLTASDLTQIRNAERYDSLNNASINSGVFITKESFLAMINDVLRGYNMELDEFIAALFGLRKKGESEYEVGLRTVQSEIKYSVTFGVAPNIDPRIAGNSTAVQAAATSFHNALKKAKVELEFNYLKGVFVNEILVGGTTVGREIDKLAYYTDDAYGAIIRGIRNTSFILGGISPEGVDFDAQNRTNLMNKFTSIYSAFVDEINIPARTQVLVDQSYVEKYLKAVSKHFKVTYTNRRFDKYLVTHLAIHRRGRLGIEPIDVEEAAKKAGSVGQDVVKDSRVVMLDYGGAVVNFQHTVRPDPVKSSRNATAKTKIVDIPNDEGLSIQFEVDTDAVDQASKALYDAERARNPNSSFIQRSRNYYEALQEDIKKDPDDFLNRFTRLIGTSRGSIQQITDATGVSAVGGQRLTLNLRHPIPAIDYNSTIYFYGAGETPTSKTFKNDATTKTAGQSSFFIVPSTIRGVYLVTKITNTFNAKENVWTQRLECSR